MARRRDASINILIVNNGPLSVFSMGIDLGLRLIYASISTPFPQ